MKYISITQIDAVTGVLCTDAPMRTGPSYPQIKGCFIEFNDESTWPITTTPEGAHTKAPLFYGYCDDDADLSVVGVVATYTQDEYLAIKTAEHQARKPFSSWIGDLETMSWHSPTPYPLGNDPYYWDEPSQSWVAETSVVRIP